MGKKGEGILSFSRVLLKSNKKFYRMRDIATNSKIDE